MVFNIKRRTLAEEVWEQGAEEDDWVYGEQLKGDSRKLHIEELNDLHTLLNTGSAKKMYTHFNERKLYVV